MTTQIGYPEERKEEIEARQLVAKATELVNIAKSIEITDNESYEKAAAFKLTIRERREAALAEPIKNKEKSHGVWKFLSSICNMIEKPYDEAEAVLDGSMIAFRRKIEAKRQEEARKAQEKAQADAKKKREEEIARAKEQGDKDAAKALKAAPLHVAAVAPKTPEAPKISGMPTRKVWKYQIDVDKLDRKYMIPDEVTIGKLVRALGAKHGISGVTAYQEEVQ